MGVGEIRASVTAGNDASCRVLEKCGFRRLGVVAGAIAIRGERYDDVQFVLPQ
jgi:RimJ/RimL family protein N-acetyltransferase